jgi:hypothetical protein
MAQRKHVCSSTKGCTALQALAPATCVEHVTLQIAAAVSIGMSIDAAVAAAAHRKHGLGLAARAQVREPRPRRLDLRLGLRLVRERDRAVVLRVLRAAYREVLLLHRRRKDSAWAQAESRCAASSELTSQA